MKSSKALFLFFCLISFLVSAEANIIRDEIFSSFRLGWFSARDKSCKEVCAEHKSYAEQVRYNSSGLKTSYVCKAKGRSSRGEIFGQNYYDESGYLSKQCVVADHNNQLSKDRKFKCLCVKLGQ